MNLSAAKAVLGVRNDDAQSVVTRSKLYGKYYWSRLKELYDRAKNARTYPEFDRCCDEITELASALILVYRTELSEESVEYSDAPWITGSQNIVAYLRSERRARFARELANVDAHSRTMIRQIEQFLLTISRNGDSNEV